MNLLVTPLGCEAVIDLEGCKLLVCVVSPRPEVALPDALGACDVSCCALLAVSVEPEMLEALLDAAILLASYCAATLA